MNKCSQLAYEYMFLLLEQKEAQERPIEEFKYESTLNWKLLKRVKSSTSVRAWVIEVEGRKYRLIQNRVPGFGDRLSAYVATDNGSMPETSTSRDALFYITGIDYLHGIEYLLRHLEGKDITHLRLDCQNE